MATCMLCRVGIHNDADCYPLDAAAEDPDETLGAGVVHKRCICEFNRRMSEHECLYCGAPANHMIEDGVWQRCDSCHPASYPKFTGYPGA